MEGTDADRVPTPRVLAWLFVLAFVLVVSIARNAYAAYGTEPSARFEVLAVVGFVTLIWNWVQQECRRCGAVFPLDFAWFLSILWFLMVPYYMWRFQHWRGIAKCGVLFAWHLAAWVAGLVVYYAIAEER